MLNKVTKNDINIYLDGKLVEDTELNITNDIEYTNNKLHFELDLKKPNTEFKNLQFEFKTRLINPKTHKDIPKKIPSKTTPANTKATPAKTERFSNPDRVYYLTPKTTPINIKTPCDLTAIKCFTDKNGKKYGEFTFSNGKYGFDSSFENTPNWDASGNNYNRVLLPHGLF